MTQHGLFKYVWCWLFHGRYRVRTFGKMMRIHVQYDVKCSRCGIEDSEMDILGYRL